MARYRRTDLKRIATPVGTIEYRDIGSGEPVMFVHGAFMNGALWDDVAFYLPPSLRLVRPDLPLGGHRLPALAEAELSPPALADVMLGLIEALDLHGVILAASDGGQAICRSALAGGDPRASRIRGLLLTNCDVVGQHPPGRIAGEAALDEVKLDSIAWSLSTIEGRRAFFRRLVWEPLLDDQICELLGSFMQSADVRRDALRALAPQHASCPSRAIKFDGPVKILWGVEDSHLPVTVGAKLAAEFPQGELRHVPRAGLLVPLDQPEKVAEAIFDLLEECAAT